MKRVLVSMGLLGALTATAAGQSTPQGLTASSFNPENPTAPIGSVEGDGIKVGEGTSLYPIIGISTGAVSNVFYEQSDGTAAGILRILGQISAGSLSMARLSRNAASPDIDSTNGGAFQYRVGLNLSWDQMLSDNDNVTSQGGLGVGALFRGLVNPNGPFSFGFDENLTRFIRAANFETDADTNRIINNLGLNLIFHPQGRSISGYLYYTNTIDVFEEDEIRFANRIQHRVGVHPTWKILPQTALYADVSMGYFSGLGNDSQKVDSYPLVAQAGIATLFTPRTSLNLHAGYTNGFYSSGPNFSAFAAGVMVAYRYSEAGRAGATYDLTYDDSVNANYYRDHAFRVFVEHQMEPLTFLIQPEMRFREYNGVSQFVMGPDTRDDFILAATAGAYYNFRNSFAATLDYRFSLVETDYRYMAGDAIDDPSFVRHQLLAGVRWAL